jgi:hypothetical protein
MAFPTTLTVAVDGQSGTEIVAAHLNSLETKVGIDSSAVVTSLDYLIKHASSIEPGHKHYQLWVLAGGSVALKADANGNLLIGAVVAGASAVRATVTATGVAPTAQPADAAQAWVADQAAGNACHHFMTEGGKTIKLYRQAHIANPTDLATCITAINAILVILENLGLTETS